MPRPSKSSKPSWERARGPAPASLPPPRPHAGSDAGGDARAPRGLRWLLVAAALGVLAACAGVAVFRHRSRQPAAAVAPSAPAVSLPPAEQSLRETVTRLPRDPDAHRALARYLLEQHRPF